MDDGGTRNLMQELIMIGFFIVKKNHDSNLFEFEVTTNNSIILYNILEFIKLLKEL